MQETHHEHLSSMMDGELEKDHVPEFLDRLQSDSELQNKLDRYGLIRSAIRGEQLPSADHDLSQRVSRILEQEPTVLAPRAFSWKSYRLAGAAMAASVAAMAIILVNQTPVTQSPLSHTPIATQAAVPSQIKPEPVLVAVKPEQSPVETANQSPIETAAISFDQSVDANFDAYLLNHNVNASAMQMPGMMPNVRLVSYGDQ